MKTFEIPEQYKSGFIARIKEARKNSDPRKKDFTPTLLDFGPVRFYIARHFGFCYGVENAIERSYKALAENKGKRILLLSQMIHNPEVNSDLQANGIDFIMDTEGNQFIPWDALTQNDVVIIPAFGTTIEIENILKEKGITTEKYNTTCPFVERVWNRAEKLGAEKYSIVIHGKAKHEETRATFSHSKKDAPSVIVRDIEETILLGKIIKGEIQAEQFYTLFKDRYSDGFDVNKDLIRIGVINQTTMLATETQAIADYLKQVMTEKYPAEDTKLHFADTRDTLCYATNDNQQATYGLLEKRADLAIVVGGYNSSNTSHLVELCEQKYPTYFISSEKEIDSKTQINHFIYGKKQRVTTQNYLPEKTPVDIILTSGASCPDTVLERVMLKILSFYNGVKNETEVLASLKA